MMDIGLLVLVGISLVLTLLLLWAKQNALEETLAEQGPSGHWRRGAKEGGSWHLIRLQPFPGIPERPAACGYIFPAELIEKDYDPSPEFRCEKCQRIYVMEKVR